jgi:hypothetical protein
MDNLESSKSTRLETKISDRSSCGRLLSIFILQYGQETGTRKSDWTVRRPFSPSKKLREGDARRERATTMASHTVGHAIITRRSAAFNRSQP